MDMAKHNQSVKLEKNTKGLSHEEAGKIVTYRILILVLADFIIGSLLDYVRADSNREYSFVFRVCPVLVWVFGAMALAACGYLVWSLVKKTDTRRYPITPAMIFALCFFLFAATLFYKSLTFTLMLAVLVIGSVLFALYYIYMNLLY